MATYTQEQRDKLARAIASGATSVSYEGKSVQYRDLNEMRMVLDMMDQDLAGRKARRRFVCTTYKHL